MTDSRPAPARPHRDLASFTGAGYDRGRPMLVQVAWLALNGLIVSRWWCPLSLRLRLLRAFGARIGTGVVIRHGVKIHWPWKLTVGDHSWIGEGSVLLNLEPVVIGSDVCVSQEVYLCTGSHRADKPGFDFDNAPIHIEDGAWLALRATVLRGVTVGADAVVGACALVVTDVAPHATILAPTGSPR